MQSGAVAPCLETTPLTSHDGGDGRNTSCRLEMGTWPQRAKFTPRVFEIFRNNLAEASCIRTVFLIRFRLKTAEIETLLSRQTGIFASHKRIFFLT